MHSGRFYISDGLRSLLYFIEISSAVLLFIAACFVAYKRRKRGDKRSFITIVTLVVSLVLFCDVSAIAVAGKVGILGRVGAYFANYGNRRYGW